MYLCVGEVYVAFFNLSEQKRVISAKTSDLAKVLPGRDFSSCQGSEVWSGDAIEITRGTLSTAVEVHGSALIVLNCNESPLLSPKIERKKENK